jgi:xylulokinase
MGWVGGISASGGSIEWLRGVLGDPSLSYADLDALLEGAARPPTGIIYLPYLSGSGSPHSDGRARAAFFGLSAAHSRADLYQAVLEGVAYEAAYIRQAAQNVVGQPIRHILAAGGGTRNRAWMQIRADVLGCPLDVLDQPEMTLLGAALLAGLGSGVYASPAEASTVLSVIPVRHYIPDAARHEAYQPVYEDFLAKQKLSSQA